MPDHAESPSVPLSAGTSRPARLIISAVVLIYAVLVTAGMLWPTSFLWGVHALAFLPPIVAAFVAAGILILAAPQLSSRYVPWLERRAAMAFRSPSRRFALGIALCAAVLFSLARIAINMYGDEKTMLAVLAKKMYLLNGLFRLEDYAPLTRLLHQQVALLTGIDQRDAIVVTSIAVGGLVV